MAARATHSHERIIAPNDVATNPLKNEPALAIIGWSNTFPGEATTPTAFWDMLCAARTAHSPIPGNRFNSEAFYHPDQNRGGTTSTRHAHFIRQDPGAFDAPFFSMSPSEAAAADPQQRLVLEATYHALENAGLSLEDVQGTNTSVYIGGSNQDYSAIFAKDPENPPQYIATGLGSSIIPSRISWFFDLHGESMYVDTACSSSLACLHQASQSLRQGKADMAIVGGVNLILTPDTSFNILSQMGFTSPDGCSYSFDSRANGYSKGEGAGIVIVKCLHKAIEDGNTIRAVLRGTGCNHDGRTPGITRPSEVAQRDNICATYDQYGLDRALTRFVEAHGTGTQVGDPIEAAGIVQALQPTSSAPIFVGAVKTNIGHLEAAAGVAGLIKVCMMLEKGLIVPNALYETPNTSIPIDEWNIKFPTEVAAWPQRGLRRASLNSFGVGGTNAHAVLDDAYHYLEEHNLVARHHTIEYPTQTMVRRSGRQKIDSASRQASMRDLESDSSVRTDTEGIGSLQLPRIFVCSASDESGLIRVKKAYIDFIDRIDLEEHGGAQCFLQNLSHTLLSQRTLLRWRSCTIASTLDELRQGLLAQSVQPVRASKSPFRAFVFNGQGAQWPGMGRELLEFPIFLTSLQEAGLFYKKLGADFDLIEELLRSDDASNINEPLISQSASTAIQIALVDLLTSWDIAPQAVVGHSSGEIAAAYCVGGLDFQSALKVAYFRGLFAKRLALSSQTSGAMIAVSLSYDDCQAAINETLGNTNGVLTIACHNSPTSMTVSGDTTCVDEFARSMQARKVLVRRLNVPVAYHSPHVESFADEYQESLKQINHRQDAGSSSGLDNRDRPVVFSSVTGVRIDDYKSLSNPMYWATNSSSMVKFYPAIMALANFVCTQSTDGSGGHNHHIFALEVGPHSTLRRPIQDSIKTVSALKNFSYASLLKRDESGVITSFRAAAEMHCHGIPVDLSKLNNLDVAAADLKLLVDLPPYPFNHSKTYWVESRVSHNYRFRPNPRHELLGVSSTDWNPLEPHWRHVIKVAENPWITHHNIDGVNLYPASGMIAMVIEAARQLVSPAETIESYTLKDLLFMAPLRVDDSDEGVEVQLRFHRPKHMLGGPSLEHDFSLYVCSKSTWTQCSRGTIAVQVGAVANEGHVRSEKNGHSISRVQLQKIVAQCSEHVPVQDYYNRSREHGYDLGPAFQILDNLHYRSGRGLACADIQLDGWIGKISASSDNIQAHVIHPTALDGLAQLCVAAITQTATIDYPPTVPVSCKTVWISNRLLSRPVGKSIQAGAEVKFRGFREVDLVCTAFDEQNQALINLDGWRQMAVSTLAPNSSEVGGKNLCYNTHWKLDIEQLSSASVREFCESEVAKLDPPDLPTDEYELISLFYTKLAITHSDAKGKSLAGFGWHTHRYLSWAKSAYSDEHFRNLLERTPNGHKLIGTEVVRTEYMQNLASIYPDVALTVYIGQRLPSLLDGESDPLDTLYRSELINAVYSGPWTRRALERLKAYMSLLSHKNPDARILEVGAGTGSSTRYIMDAIAPPDNAGSRPSLPKFGHYYYTDVSLQFFEEAKRTFSEYPERMTFTILDMDKDPEEQGFIYGEYDVVYCGLVLHALRNVESALRNIRKLLKPGGKLVMVESTNVTTARATFVFGLLPSWWLASEASRQHNPLLTVTEWDEILRKTGFSGVELSLDDDPKLERRTLEVLIATAVPETSPGSIPAAGSNITVILDRTERLQQEVALHFAEISKDSVGQVTFLSVDDISAESISGQSCIVLKEIGKAWLERLSPTGFATMKRLLNEASSLLWVTGGAGLVPTHPQQDLASGLGRNVRSERWDTKFTHLALDVSDDATHIAQQILKTHAIIEKQLPEQCEDVLRERNGQIYIARVDHCSALDTYVQEKTAPKKPEHTTLAACHDRSLRLTMDAPGQLETFYFMDDEDANTLLANDEVRIDVKAVGLTEKDVSIALGKTQAHKTSLGFQFAGTVSESRSNELRCGDRVMGMTSTGSLRTSMRAKTCLVRGIDANTSFVEAAATPISLTMAYYCIVDKAALQEGESILIHDGTSGIGQCAIQIAHNLGGRVFATVGSNEEKRFLIEHYRICEAHVFSKHDDTFSTQVRELTNGKGVDVILNKLAGDMFDLSWSLAAPLGRFVEIGKSDLQLGRTIRTGQLLNDVSFIPVDFAVRLLRDPRSISRAFEAAMRLHAQGHVHAPLSPRTYSIGQIEHAFRSLHSGNSYGAVVVRMDEHGTPLQALPSLRHSYSLDANATFVVAGGFGGLGKACIKFMVSRGARYFMVPTASQDPDKAVAQLLEEISVNDVKIFGQRCDISSETDLKTFLDTGLSHMPPIKGCIQSAMMLRDGILDNMTWSDWTTCIEPKVAGTWNLHQYLPSDLNFFVVWSSIAALAGSRGQANYAAANAFQDALVRHRLSRGQKAFGFNLGPLLTVGTVARQGLSEQLLQDGFAATKLNECMALLEWALDPAHGRPEQDPDLNQIVTGLDGIRDPQARRKGKVYWLERPLFSFLRNYDNSSDQDLRGSKVGEESLDIAEQLKSRSDAPLEAIEFILQLLLAKLSRVLGVPITELERSKPLQSFGVDSLVALEIRYWFMKDIKANLAVFDITGAASLTDICSLAWSKSSYNVAVDRKLP